ncbi:DUF5035 family protein [Bacteroides sp.]
MKKLFLALLLSLFLASCSDSAESPVIEIAEFFIKGDAKDYSKDMASIPSLKVGDEVIVSLKLDGNGENLGTFMVKEKEKQLGIKIDLPDGASSDPNFTKPEEGIIGFKDGVHVTELRMKARVQTVADADAILTFYLSSKAECESAQEMIELKTEEDKE